MRRGLSILLALLFGVGPLSVALPGGDEAAVPACCRRHGAHHCAMSAQMSAMVARAEADKTAVSAPSTCPHYPGPAMALLTSAHALTAAALRFPGSHATTRAPIPSDPRAAFGGSDPHAGRGPPPSHVI